MTDTTEAQTNALERLRETEEADVDFLLAQLGINMDSIAARTAVRSFRKQNIQLGVIHASQPPAAPVETTCPGGIDPGFEDCPKCGASMEEACAYAPPAAPVDISTLTPNATTIAALQEADHIIAAFKAAKAAAQPPADQVEPPLTSPAIDAFIAKHSPDDEIVRELNEIRDINSHLLHGLWGEKQRSAEYYDYFEMLWNWFADESRRGAEDMRANAANGGLSADDFKGMLDEHESALVAGPVGGTGT